MMQLKIVEEKWSDCLMKAVSLDMILDVFRARNYLISFLFRPPLQVVF